MNINRHNYEEFFLMYTDNELSAEGRAAVEAFVADNPDLQEELDMLMQTILPPDDALQFDSKDLLLRKDEGISIENHEEYFLLYVDGELNKQQATETEQFVLKHPQLQENFVLIQQSKLQPENIAYPNKSELYRREGKVVGMLWMRLSVAAAFILLSVLAWILVDKNETPATPSVAATTTVSVPARPIAKTGASEKKSATAVTFTAAPSYNQQSSTAMAGKTVKEKSATITRPEQPAEEQVAKQQMPAAAPTEAVSIPVLPRTFTPAGEEDAVLVRNEPPAPKEINPQVITAQQPVTQQPDQLASQAVYRQVINTDDEDRTVNIGSLQINKNKIKSLFKKASGIFGKKAEKDNTDKPVQVAGFEVRTT